MAQANIPPDSWRDEGIIKFDARWQRAAAFPVEELASLIEYRDILYRCKLIGQYDDGVAYGNISQRIGESDRFYISGSATGGIKKTGNRHFSRVDDVDIDSNRLWCTGPVIASSESMTHAVLYQTSAATNGVVHVHNRQLWESLIDVVPTTPAGVAYGTPAMARAMIDLFETGNLDQYKILVMAGHEEGVFTFGDSLEDAMQTLMQHYKEIRA